MSNFGFNNIPIRKVKSCEIVSEEDRDWKKRQKKNYNKESKSKRERKKLIEENKEAFEKFKNRFNELRAVPDKLLVSKKKLKEEKKAVILEKKDKKVEIESPFEAKDQIKSLPYRKEWDRDKRKWTIYNSNPEKVKKKLTWSPIYIGKDSLPNLTKNLDLNLKDLSKRRNYAIDKLENLYSKRVKPAARISFIENLKDKINEDYNTNRAKAFLRDLGALESKNQNKDIGKKGREFERKVRKAIATEGLPLKNRVLKATMKNGRYRFKEMDIHTEINNENYIIEVFKGMRKRSTKKRQLATYAKLYKIATGNSPNFFFITDSPNGLGITLTDLFNLLNEKVNF